MTDPGDEVICPEPLYANYVTLAKLAGCTVVGVGTSAADGYRRPFADGGGAVRRMLQRHASLPTAYAPVVAELSVRPWYEMPEPNLTSAPTECRLAMAWPACRRTAVGSGAEAPGAEQAMAIPAISSAAVRVRGLIYSSQAPQGDPA